MQVGYAYSLPSCDLFITAEVWKDINLIAYHLRSRLKKLPSARARPPPEPPCWRPSASAFGWGGATAGVSTPLPPCCAAPAACGSGVRGCIHGCSGYCGSGRPAASSRSSASAHPSALSTPAAMSSGAPPASATSRRYPAAAAISGAASLGRPAAA
eukprot:151325-Chlamydomonas_euryale.AAC.26